MKGKKNKKTGRLNQYDNTQCAHFGGKPFYQTTRQQ